jgi:hypothetical protein
MEKKTTLEIPKKAWVDFTPEEKKKFQPHIKAIVWKQEGRVGPVWVEFDQIEKDEVFGDSPVSINYQNGMKMSGEDRHFAAWFKPEQAEKIAKAMGVKFEEC